MPIFQASRLNIELSPQEMPWVGNYLGLGTLDQNLGVAMSGKSIFEYFYRDASNYKSWGGVLLAGEVPADVFARLRRRFDSEEFFVAEQLGLPTLYGELWELSDGPTEDDHVWHTFHALRPAVGAEINMPIFATLDEFVLRLEAVLKWEVELSPHWTC